MSRIPFFDHTALIALRNQPGGAQDRSNFPLSLLIAANCQNTTSQGLNEALQCFTGLTFLDLSRTLAARDRGVLARLKRLHSLQVLKLRNVHLRDEDIPVLANAIGTRVRSLDVSQNHLTDQSVRVLLADCFAADNPATVATPCCAYPSNFEDWPPGFVKPDDPAVMDHFKDESYDRRLVRRLTSQVAGGLPFEDYPNSGITHLFITDNELSVEGIAALIRTKKLFVLDAGSLDTMKAIGRQTALSQTSATRGTHEPGFGLPGPEKLVPVLGRCAQQMTSLRIDHAVVTEIGPPKEDELPLTICELDAENSVSELESAEQQINELDGSPPLYEIDSQELAPRYELPGDPVHIVVSQAMGEKPQLSQSEEGPDLRRGSAFAPEVFQNEHGNDEDTVILTATGLGPVAQRVNGVSPEPSYATPSMSMGDLNLSVALVQKQRRELREKQTSEPHGLMPGMLAQMRTLTLTDVPCHEHSRNVVDALIRFLQYCSLEAELASIEARLKPHPVRQAGHASGYSLHQHDTREIFALQRLVLEMAQEEPPSSAALKSLGQYRPRRSKFVANRTMSSTEDADSEAFWSASQNDFTFFDDEEECGLPAAETSAIDFSHSPMLSEKITAPSDDDVNSTSYVGPTPQKQSKIKTGNAPTTIDVILEVAKFRKERKAAYEIEKAKGARSVDGYWPGEVKVVRSNASKHTASEGMIDYYGNFFENGYVYR